MTQHHDRHHRLTREAARPDAADGGHVRARQVAHPGRLRCPPPHGLQGPRPFHRLRGHDRRRRRPGPVLGRGDRSRPTSINTNDENRDNHVRTNDFLNVDEFPTLTFRSTKVELGPSGDWKVTGDLTIRGVTRPVVLDVEFEGVIQDPWGNQRLGFTASGEIDRNDFGVSFNAALETGGFVVCPKVKLEIEAEAVRQA